MSNLCKLAKRFSLRASNATRRRASHWLCQMEDSRNWCRSGYISESRATIASASALLGNFSVFAVGFVGVVREVAVVAAVATEVRVVGVVAEVRVAVGLFCRMI